MTFKVSSKPTSCIILGYLCVFKLFCITRVNQTFMDLPWCQFSQHPWRCIIETDTCSLQPMEGSVLPSSDKQMDAGFSGHFPFSFQCLLCWKMRVSKGFPVSNRWATGNTPPAQKVTAPTAWMKLFATWTNSTASCVTRVWTQRSSSRCSSSSSTWSMPWPWTTSCWGRMSAHGAQACSWGGAGLCLLREVLLML